MMIEWMAFPVKMKMEIMMNLFQRLVKILKLVMTMKIEVRC